MTSLNEVQLTEARLIEARAQLNAAERQYAEERTKLFRDGKPLYSNEEQARREKEIERGLQRAVRSAQQTAQAIIDEAQSEIASIETDPLAVLSDEELGRSHSLRPYVMEDVEHLSPDGLSQRLRQAAESGDRVQQALWLRYGRRRLENMSSRDHVVAYGVRPALDELSDALFGSKAKRETAEARIKEALGFSSGLITRNYLHTEYGQGRAVRG